LPREAEGDVDGCHSTGRNPGLVNWEWYKDSLIEGRERGKNS
jgi:hypothetical protein